MPAMEMVHADDPAKELLARIGDLSTFEHPVTFSNVLVAIYQRPTVTKSGIHLADVTRDEDKWQGKVGLIIAKGPKAFKDDGNVSFDGFDPAIGSWVVFRTSDTWQLAVNKVPCRMMSDVAVRMVVPAPDKVF